MTIGPMLRWVERFKFGLEKWAKTVAAAGRSFEKNSKQMSEFEGSIRRQANGSKERHQYTVAV